MGFLKKIKPGNYTNRKGKHYTVHSDGSMSTDVNKLIQSEEFKRQLKGFEGLYMQQTLMALYKGEEPPMSAGGYGILTKKKLRSVWNDEWQAEFDKMMEYYDVTYNSFFNIPEDHPPVGILLTANEIVETYGSKEEKS